MPQQGAPLFLRMNHAFFTVHGLGLLLGDGHDRKMRERQTAATHDKQKCHALLLGLFDSIGNLRNACLMRESETSFLLLSKVLVVFMMTEKNYDA